MFVVEDVTPVDKMVLLTPRWSNNDLEDMVEMEMDLEDKLTMLFPVDDIVCKVAD